MERFYDKIIDNQLINSTTDARVANTLGWTKHIDNSLTEKAWDGKIYVVGKCPPKPIEIQQFDVKKVRDNYLDSTDKYMVSDRKKTPLMKQYRKYLRDYTKQDKWWEKNPMNFEEYKLSRKKHWWSRK